ncbi:MAG: LysM peptidoglycan-binding domain-containing protein [Candidatus Kaiserbacteria bacterium]|nr:MAG: LysM peptidoglycan-binding domain-containing protein [Candidatus Kaiserbacteria bacterium]
MFAISRILAALATLFVFASVASANETYTVKPGNNLIWIAKQVGVSWQAMLLANEEDLKQKYERICGNLSDEFRNRTENKGRLKGGKYFCNDNYMRAYGNTLQPGWTLEIPAAIAPATVEKTVSEIKGDRIALVIDDTGSMSNKREETANFYLAAIKKFEKKIVGVWLYANGKVRKYEAGGVKFSTRGNYENTFGALEEAAKEKPDAIILVTDEPGDDWNWGRVNVLPRVVAHCLPDYGTATCRENLQRLVKETRGRYIEGFSVPTAAR